MILLFGFLAGLDNLQVCSALGLLPLSRSRMRLLAAGFVFCESAAPLLGLLLGHAVLALTGPYVHFAGPLMTILCGAAVLASSLWGEPEKLAGGDARMLFGLPVSLSLDNLVAGAGISSLPYPVWMAALTIGLIGGGMSCAGLYGAAWIKRWFHRIVPVRVELLTGVYLCALAVRMLVADKV